MSFRNHSSGTCMTNTKKHTGEHQIGADVKSSNSSVDNRNGMWRRSKHSSHNPYSTLPRKIHSTQSSLHSAMNNKIPENNNATNGRSTMSSGGHSMKHHREGLHLPVTSIRNQYPPLPPDLPSRRPRHTPPKHPRRGRTHLEPARLS